MDERTKEVEWRDVVDYEGLYMVSSDGRVKSKRRILTIKDKRGFANKRHLKEIDRKSRTNRSGYTIVDLHNRTVSTHQMHKLVARAFIGEPCNDQTDINHKNGVTTDNRVENLEWCTRSENMIHAMNTGLFGNRGELSSRAKIKRKQVDEIRDLAAKGELTQKQIGRLYGISQAQVSRIYKGTNWAYPQ